MRTLKIATTAVAIVGIVTPAQPAQRSDDSPATEASSETPDDQPALPSSAAAPGNTSTPAKTDEHPDKTYWKHAVGPTSVGRAAMGAGINQLNNTPHEWGQGAQGFGKRFASSFGRHILKKGIQYPVAKLFHEELSYHRSNKTGFGPRLKYALLGVVTCARAEDHDRLASFRSASGIVAAPDPVWLLLRGMKTLALRVERQSRTALELARRLASHPAVLRVRYPGLGPDPVAAQYVDAFGPLLSFDVADARAAVQVERSLALIENATSLGGVASTLEARARWEPTRVPPGLLRLSVGLEDVEDLWGDLARALDELRDG